MIRINNKPRILALANVKNEGWIIERWLQRTSEFADAIIVLDDGSIDETPKILKDHPKVAKVICDPPGYPYNLGEIRNRLLEASREFGPEWIFYLDADEIMDARLADRIDGLMNRQDAGRYYFQEITLWRNTQYYRVDKPEKYMRIHHGFPVMLRLIPTLKWKHPARLGLRYHLWLLLKKKLWLPKINPGDTTMSKLTGVQGETIDLPDIVKLHYHFADWERAWRNHMAYAVRKAIDEKKRAGFIPEIVEWASDRLNENGLELAPVKPEWGVL